MKKYQIIYADPPWGHDDKMETHSFSQLNHYKTMTTKEICDLEILGLKICLIITNLIVGIVGVMK